MPVATVPSVENRLYDARAKAAVLVQLADLSSGRAEHVSPPRAFWQGISLIASEIEEAIAATKAALSGTTLNQDAPAVDVER